MNKNKKKNKRTEILHLFMTSTGVPQCVDVTTYRFPSINICFTTKKVRGNSSQAITWMSWLSSPFIKEDHAQEQSELLFYGMF